MKKLILAFLGCALLMLGSSCVTTVRPAHSRTVIIKKAPAHHKVVHVKGRKYYHWNGKHYHKTHKGFVYVKL